MVFPLPLVPFEEYMLADDRPAYPMNFFFRLRFTGFLDPGALDAALAAAVVRHPLLGATACREKGRRQWQPVATQPPVCRLDSGPSAALPPVSALDVRTVPGLRLMAQEGPGRTDLTAQFHHSCCDGLGAVRFLQDLLICYLQATGSHTSAGLRALQVERLRNRGSFGLSTVGLLRLWRSQAIGLLGARQFLMRSPMPIVPHEPQPDATGPPANYPASCSCRLEVDESDRLAASARLAGVTVNDLLLRDLLLALEAWRQRSLKGNEGWLRVSVPMDLRTVNDRHLPAANVVSMVFLDRRAEQLADPQRLLASIHDEMQLIKRHKLNLTFVLSLRACRWMPGALRRATGGQRCQATCVLTNLGSVFKRFPQVDEEGRLHLGGAVLEEIDILAPIRPLTSAAFAVHQYAGRLGLTLHYDPRVLTAEQAAELLEGLLACVRRTAAESDPPGLRYEVGL